MDGTCISSNGRPAGVDSDRIEAVVFDYGNTLVEFTARHVDALDAAIARRIETAFGPFDVQRYRSLRRAAYRSPYFHPELHESTIPDLLRALVRELFGREPRNGELEPIIEAHDTHFVKLVDAPDYLEGLLAELGARYKLALVSNYPCGRSIRASLQHTGIASHMRAVVVSGEVGRVKPHPLPFRAALEQLGTAPERALFVGDNWLGDVQGAKRIGMWAAHTLQFDTLEVFDREDGHHEADLTIHHLAELTEHL